jgi:hypothetical protein
MPAIRRSILYVILSVIGFPCLAENPVKDPEIKPGQVFHLTFPQLGPSENAAVARMGIYIPKDYAADRRFPLLVWFGGGAGGDDPGPARQIAGDSGFICVGLPYQKDLVWKTPWTYYEPMLRELGRVVPNIHPSQRACSGFSSGGAAICFSMVNKDPGFRDYFYAFMPGGAGWAMGDFSPLRKRPVFAFVGSKDTRVTGFRGIETAAKQAGADITYFEYDAGHEMPTEHLPKIRQWLIEKLVLRDLPQLRKAMQAAVDARQYGKAFHAASEIRNVTPPTMPDHAEARAVIAKMLPFGEALAQKVLTAPLAEQQRFALEWKGCDFTGPVAEKCAVAAAGQLTKILAQQPVSPAMLKKYLTFWEGFPAAAVAMEHYEKFAAQALVQVRELPAPDARNRGLQQFIATWAPSPSCREARQLREEIARQELAVIKEIKAKGTMKSKLHEYLRNFVGTDAAIEAKSLLESK